MNNQINFEDNIFILNTRIRAVSDLLILDANAEFFLEKTIEDVNFISTTTNRIFENLSANKQLISRDEQLHNLYETIESFMDVLNMILNGSGCFSVQTFPILTENITSLFEICKNKLKEIDDILIEIGAHTVDPRVVSTDELSELLKDLS
ncbi:hypothetical protein FACS189494_07720 [Spirochaetia bacterium]|nr:hypothetical protein FACS189494_07720 [Spirochaetia bacterium]